MTGTLETHPLISVRPEWSVKDAARLMADCSISALGVIGPDQELVGVITERDLSWFVARGKDPSETKLADVVNDFPVTVQGPIDEETALQRMRSAHVRHLIVSEDGAYRIVSLRDLAFNHMAPEPAETPDGTRRLVSTMLDAYGASAAAWYRAYSDHPATVSKRGRRF